MQRTAMVAGVFPHLVDVMNLVFVPLGWRHVRKHPIAKLPRSNGGIECKILAILYLIACRLKAINFALQFVEQVAAVFQRESLISARQRHYSNSYLHGQASRSASQVRARKSSCKRLGRASM